MSQVPQPSPDRITPFAGHPLVVNLGPEDNELVVRTALNWAQSLAVELYFAHVDTARLTVAEHEDGSVEHTSIDPDGLDDTWERLQSELVGELTTLIPSGSVDWHFRFLAGRPDRALTHLARAVDAAAFVVSTQGHHSRWHPSEFLNESLAARLSHHQHRPVLVVPHRVVDWKAKPPWQ